MDIVPFIEWISVIILMLVSLCRSWNIGYQKESYMISTIFQTVLVLKAIRVRDYQLLMMNIFYTVNGCIAVYRWS